MDAHEGNRAGENVLPADLTPDAIRQELRGEFGKALRCFDQIASTNPEAMDWAMSGAPEGAVVVADHQTAGRGRGTRRWASAPRSALQFSLVLRPEAAPDRLGLLTTALGLACAGAVEEIAGITAKLKWPNDVVVKERKLSGCLAETKLDGARVVVAIAGMGVNVSSWSLSEDAASVATSIEDECGHRCSRAKLLAAILEGFESLYPFVTGPGGEVLIRRAEERSDLTGREVRASLPDGTDVTGTATGLDPNGALRIETGDGPRILSTGDVVKVRPL